MKKFNARRPWIPLLLVAALFVAPLATAAAQSGALVPADVTVPLPDAARQILREIPDEGTEQPEQHYYRSNEYRQDLLRPHFQGLGGAFVGVGTDQNYTMAAMAGSKLLFVVDYDPLINWIHAIYGVLIKASDTPGQLIGHFGEERVRQTEALLRSELADHPRLDRVIRHWKRRRGSWEAYLVRVSRLDRGGEPHSWLSDRSMYDYVRAMHQSGRVISRNGDVTAERTLRAVGQAAQRLGCPIRVLYFSNAEQFFTYTPSFQANMRALPTDDRTLVFRTIRHRRIENAEDGRWHYMIHPFDDFVARLDTGAYRRVFSFTTDLLAAGSPHLGSDGISTMGAEVPRRALEELRSRRARR